MSIAASLPASSRLVQYYQLTKPRVVQLIVFCALIGMVLAVPGVPVWAGLSVLYTSDAAEDTPCVALGGRSLITFNNLS